MKKIDVLGIGCGGCGNNLVNTFLDMDKRYTGIFMNTNLSEMENLKHYDRERRSFYIANADGSGKNRELTETYIKEEAPKFADMILKFPQKYVIFFSSGNGGTGSKAIIMLTKLIKQKLKSNKSINFVTTFPSLDESEVDFNNTIDFWNEVIELKNKGLIDSIQFIDNDKPYSEEEINIRAMKQLDQSIDLIEGKLDTTDIDRVHGAKGYKIILDLDDNIKDLNKAIDKAIESSVYFMPSNFDCNCMVGNINGESFSEKDIKSKFDIYDFNKFNVNTGGKSTLVLGGCDMPTEAIGLIQEALKETKEKKRQRNVKQDVFVEVNNNSSKPKINTEEITESKLSSKDLNDMFSDDSFWD
jgi:hypothetical protein